jgi:hypothetical protein
MVSCIAQPHDTRCSVLLCREALRLIHHHLQQEDFLGLPQGVQVILQ